MSENNNKKELPSNKIDKLKEITNKISESDEIIEDNTVEKTGKSNNKEHIPMLDYNSMDLEKLYNELQKLLKKYSIEQIKQNVDAIKNSFDNKFRKLLEQKKEVFLSNGGNSIDFHFSSPVKIQFNKLILEYKSKKKTYYHQLEKKLKENLEKRTQIIKQLKNLIEKADTKTMYADFKQLDARWRAIGSVPRTKYNDIWKIYHHHVERFYDLLHLNNDFRKLDFKHNLEEKIKLIVRAESLLKRKFDNQIIKELQELHRLWKEEIGPVEKEYKQEIWSRFRAVTKKINDKRHEYFRSLKSKHRQIIEQKLSIISKIEAYDTSNNKTHKDWQKSTQEIESLRKKFLDSGKLPHSKNQVIWQKFKEAVKKINQHKNAFYKLEKKIQKENLIKKKALVEIAENLKNSEDWQTASNTMKKIQADWKKIGHVSSKSSDDLWNRFKESCNYYFNRLHEQENKLNNEQQIIVDAKKEFLEQLKIIQELTLQNIKDKILEWKELGKLPPNMLNLEEKFNEQINKMIEKLSLSKQEITIMKFKNLMDSYLTQQQYKKLDFERLFVKRKVDEITQEIQQLENNLSFISNATQDNPFVKKIILKINKCKEISNIWQLKLKYLKKLDY